ncbi:MAG: murein biosynthesis integral membrane protein MurJ [Acidobacteria bacterium]|nr:murein biosynthesis integral membrane protein MurJ [Acidobacteriota bacterium]
MHTPSRLKETLPPKRRSSGHNAVLIGAGILLSRLIGLVRERAFAHYFGNSDAADVFKAALRIPNLLQNLFGEGALSSSFIPVYAHLLAKGEKEEADRVARVIASILAVAMSVLVLAGVLATPLLIDLIAPGFQGEKRDFTIQIVRILFPGMGILVLSAWCLGILNSHRRFFLPYAAPVLWNLAMIGALVWFGTTRQSYPLAETLAWGAVAGSVLQFGVQLPTVLRLVGRIRFQFETVSSNVRTVIRNFVPGVAARGVNQVSSYVDEILASFLPAGSIAALGYAQTLYLLPVSLFGMAISNAELPEMASRNESGSEALISLCRRINEAMQRVAFFVIPSLAAILLLGDTIVAALFQTGRFSQSDVQLVWIVLGGYAVGLLAATIGRLYTSAYWALRDTRTPLRFAVVRVTLSALLGWLFAFPLPRAAGIDPRMSVAGLTFAAGISAWVEFGLLRRSMNRRIGKTGVPYGFLARVSGAAAGAALVAFLAKDIVDIAPPYSGIIVLSIFGAVYLAATATLGVPEALKLLKLAFRR